MTKFYTGPNNSLLIESSSISYLKICKSYDDTINTKMAHINDTRITNKNHNLNNL